MIDGAAAGRILHGHFTECFQKEASLFSSDDDAIHEFRLTCKRLRFAIERFQLPQQQPLASALAEITDELGSAHDSTVLTKRARKLDAGAVAWRALQDRSRHMKKARESWLRLAPALRRLSAADLDGLQNA